MGSQFDKRFIADAIPMLEEEHGRHVRLVRGPLSTDVFVARRDPRDYASIDFAAINFRQEMAEYLLPILDVVLDGEPVKPQVNDILEEGDLVNETFTVTDRWELRAPDDETPAVQMERTVGHDWRVHCQIVKAGCHDG